MYYPIKGKKLRKICKRCGNSFHPSSKNDKVCEECWEITRKNKTNKKGNYKYKPFKYTIK